jgi:hypothetical protein
MERNGKKWKAMDRKNLKKPKKELDRVLGGKDFRGISGFWSYGWE